MWVQYGREKVSRIVPNFYRTDGEIYPPNKAVNPPISNFRNCRQSIDENLIMKVHLDADWRQSSALFTRNKRLCSFLEGLRPHRLACPSCCGVVAKILLNRNRNRNIISRCEGFGHIRLPAHVAWAMWGRGKDLPKQKQNRNRCSPCH